MVDCWRCQAAGTPIFDRVWRPGVVFASGTPAGVHRVGDIVVLALSSQHRHTLLECAFTDCRFGYCLVAWADRPPPKAVRTPLRSDRFLFSSTAVCHLNVTVRNSGVVLERWVVTTTDGAYPCRQRRGIAPVQPIMWACFVQRNRALGLAFIVVADDVSRPLCSATGSFE